MLDVDGFIALWDVVVVVVVVENGQEYVFSYGDSYCVVDWVFECGSASRLFSIV